MQGIKQQGAKVRRIIIVSKKRLTEEAEWFDERRYPFNKKDIINIIYGSKKKALEDRSGVNRIGWVLQQLLKLYAPLVIPNISSNVLVLDADTIFLNPVTFLNASHGALFCTGTEWHTPYFDHGAKLIPGFKRLYPHYSGIVHHMLLQRSIIEDFWKTVESTHQMKGWKAFCRCIPREGLNGSPCSEYELYFNYALSHTDQVEIRPLKWENLSRLSQLKNYPALGYHYASVHNWGRQEEEADTPR